jgi:phospholipid/cholesterol/gamma-HCH transport system substrate-binding protein
MFRKGLPVNPKLIGAAVVVVSLVAIALAFVSHKGLPGRPYTYVTAAFDNVPAGLKPTNDVRVRGVRLGQVHHIFFEDGEARVEMQLPGGFDAYKDATVRIRSRSLLGQKYVQIDPGTAAAGPLDDAVIGKDRTDVVVEIVELPDTLDAPTRRALTTAVRELGGGAAGRGRDLNDVLAASPDMLADLGVTADTLTDEETRLVAFLVAAERLGGRFVGREAQLEALIGQLGQTLGAVAVDGGKPLAQAVDRLPSTLDALTPALRDLGGAATALGPAVADLGPAASTLGAVTPDLRAALREMVPTLRKMPGVNAQAVPAVGALTQTMADARPLAPALRRAFASLAPPLEVLAPYAAEVDLLLDGVEGVFDHRDDKGNRYLRVMSIFAAINQSGCRNPYPAPGRAANDRCP